WAPIGGAGVGVPVGGATNAILTKASAGDHATTWTTAPILTGLTMNGAITLANSVNVRGLNTSSMAEDLLALATDNRLYLGGGLGAGRDIYIGAGGASTRIVGPVTLDSTLVSKHAVRAA